MKEIVFISERDLDICKAFDEEKLSVTSVKYSKGHDADCMKANLKIGSKIVGTVWDDSWGGDFEYDGKEVKKFEVALNRIIKKYPSFVYRNIVIEYDHDVLISLLIDYTKEKRDCKNKTLVRISKNPFDVNQNLAFGIKSYSYPVQYSTLQEDNILNDFKEEEKEGFKYIEIVNKRYV